MLEIKNLNIFARDGKLLDDVSFIVQAGESIGIVGESGSGKSITSLSIMRLLNTRQLRASGEAVYLKGNDVTIDLLKATDATMRELRGKDIAMIFQEPMTALNPVMRCGRQVAESIALHQGIAFREALAQTHELFEKVELPDPAGKLLAYPHQLSGGQKQRVMIAMALANKPRLIIADEPTTALDVTVQAAILRLLKSLVQEYGSSLLFISHDLGVIKDVADRVIVMQRGRIVEQGRAEELFLTPQHPYTKALLACRPVNNIDRKRLPVVSDFLDQTSDAGPQTSDNADVKAANDILEIGERIKLDQVISESSRNTKYASEAVISVRNLSKHYHVKTGLFNKSKLPFIAVDNVNFDIHRGETLGLVGESGCGKTTLSRALLMLIPPSNGSILFNGNDITTYNREQLRRLRKQIQIIFQDPYGALNPRITAGDAIAEVLLFHKIVANHKEAFKRAGALLEKVGLSPQHLYRYPHEFSGGQRQRLCIARALAVEPEVMVCDESVSALDVSVQAQVLNLLKDLQDEFRLTYLFISHDLSVIRFMCDRVMVMQAGRIVENNTVEQLFTNPQTEYTRKLLAAIPGSKAAL